MNHYLYKTTCLHPDYYGLEYVGILSCEGDPSDDNYIGSGRALWELTNKIGKEHFRKEILVRGPTREYIAQQEAAYVDEEYLARPWVLNLLTGGEEESRFSGANSEAMRAKMKAMLSYPKKRAKLSKQPTLTTLR